MKRPPLPLTDMIVFWYSWDNKDGVSGVQYTNVITEQVKHNIFILVDSPYSKIIINILM